MQSRQPDAVIVAAGALACGAPLALAPVSAALGLTLVAVLAWRRGALVVVGGLVLCVVAALRAQEALDVADRGYRRTVVALSEPTVCRFRARVSSSPMVFRRGRAGNDARLDAQVESADCEVGELPRNTVMRLYGAPEGLARGDVVVGSSRLAPVRLFFNPGLRDPRVRIAIDGVTVSGSLREARRAREGRGLLAWIDRRRAAIRARIEATFSPSMAPFARALVLGECDLRVADREAFKASGLAHLLAVSGTHLVFAVVALARALELVLRRVVTLARRIEVARVAAAICIPAAWLYAELAGGGGSAFRAALMLMLAMLGRAAGRRALPERAFALSVAIGALVQPLAICDLSFALSVAATGGLLLARHPIRRVTADLSRSLRALAATMLATLAASSACAPVLLGIGPRLPLMGVAANVLAAPVGELVALPVCLAHAVLWWAPGAEQGAAIVGQGALAVVQAIAHAAAASPLASLTLPPPTPGQLAVLASAATAAWLHPERRRWCGLVAALALGALEIGVRAEGAPHGELRVTMLDVGQGDALLVDLPNGRAMLIDGGGLVGSPVDVGERVVAPVLRARRRDAIDVVVVSHPHPDHYGGLEAGLDGIAVAELWWPGLAPITQPTGPLARWVGHLKRQGTRVRDATELCDAFPRFGAAKARILAPCPGPDLALAANDNSLVIKLQLGQRSVLLMGDAERATEERVLSTQPHELLRADLLKVGHHGSRTSTTPALLAAVRPALAAISCGVRNRFGHPHSQTLASLEVLRIEVRRTDRGGALIWATDGRGVRHHQLGRPE